MFYRKEYYNQINTINQDEILNLLSRKKYQNFLIKNFINFIINHIKKNIQKKYSKKNIQKKIFKKKNGHICKKF